ncbi:MAG: hypothetical protein Q9186_004276 [Xanthomendoza sp. 1 TL-2023]
MASSIDRVPNEILSCILECISDFASLSNFLVAFGPALILYRARFKVIIPCVLNNHGSSQLEKIVSQVLALRSHATSPRPRRISHVKEHYEDVSYNPKIPLDMNSIADPIALVHDMGIISSDLSAFEASFVSSCFQYRNRDMIVEPRPSATETYRIRRALWRFQLMCTSAYFQSPNISKRQRIRFDATRYFMSLVTEWEYDELLCIYHHLCSWYQQKVKFRQSRSAKPAIWCQSPQIQRLLTAIGYNLYDPTPRVLNSGRRNRNVFHQAFTPSRHADHTRGTYYGQRNSISDGCEVPLAMVPTLGWALYDGLNQRRRRETPRGLPWRHNGALDIHKWGYCIWDSERLDAWGGWKDISDEASMEETEK